MASAETKTQQMLIRTYRMANLAWYIYLYLYTLAFFNQSFEYYYLAEFLVISPEIARI
jgi:hypothetical protein